MRITARGSADRAGEIRRDVGPAVPCPHDLDVADAPERACHPADCVRPEEGERHALPALAVANVVAEARPRAVDPRRADRFYAAIRTYWPGLRDGALAPGYAGIRPKISGPGEPAADFVIQGPAEHGVPGLVNLFGIESPGLTASLALADDVAALFRD